MYESQYHKSTCSAAVVHLILVLSQQGAAGDGDRLGSGKWLQIRMLADESGVHSHDVGTSLWFIHSCYEVTAYIFTNKLEQNGAWALL